MASPFVIPSGSQRGSLFYWDGASLQPIAAPSAGQFLYGANGIWAPHTFTVADLAIAIPPTRGDVITAQGATPAWARLALSPTAGDRVYLGAAGADTEPAYYRLFAVGNPGSSAVGDAAAAGSVLNAARLDHTHGRESFGAVTGQTSYGAASANGSAATLARSDHAHGTVAHDSYASVVMASTDRGTWTPGFTGFATPPTVTSATWQKFGGMVAIHFVQNALGTSNANTFTITGLPFAPANGLTDFQVMVVVDGGANATGYAFAIASTTLTLSVSQNQANTWNATATAKGVYSFTLVYPYS